MLPVQIDNLSAYLKPPLGYSFEKGFTTTYSLHLDTLLTIPMFLDGRLSEENAVIENYAAVVKTIIKYRKKFKVYVQKGEMISSSFRRKKASKLYELLRPMIREIDKNIEVASFHPKLWLLCYRSENRRKYRLIILSKNLTNSKDLDIAAVFDGSEGGVEDVNKNINDSLSYFCQKVLQDKTFSKNELKNIAWENIEGYILDNLFILPRDKEKLPFLKSGKINKETIIFSPFVSDNIFANKNSILVTREEEIDREVCNRLYAVNSSVIEEETFSRQLDMFVSDSRENSGSDKIYINELHAKIYLLRNNRESWLLFGSANATHRGLSKNSEILVQLQAPKSLYKYVKNYIEQSKLFLPLTLQQKCDEAQEDEVENIVEVLERYKIEVVRSLNISAVYEKGKLVLKSELHLVDKEIKIEVTPASKICYKEYKPELSWSIKISEVTGLFIFKMSKGAHTIEFMVQDQSFKTPDKFLKKVEEEAIDKSEDFLKANIFAFLQDGNRTRGGLRDMIREEHEEGIFNHCSKNGFEGEYIYDLLLEKYAENSVEFHEVLNLMQKVKEYQPLVEMFTKG